MTEYVGLDVSREETSFCVMDISANVMSSGRTLCDPFPKSAQVVQGRIVLFNHQKQEFEETAIWRR